MNAKYIFTYCLRLDGKLSPYHHILCDTKEDLIASLKETIVKLEKEIK